MIQVKPIALTTAQLNNSNTTPISALASPAAGFINNIIGLSANYTFNTTPFNDIGNMHLVTDDAGSSAILNDIYIGLLNQSAKYQTTKELPAQVIFSTVGEILLKADTDGVAGDGSMIYYLIYETKALV